MLEDEETKVKLLNVLSDTTTVCTFFQFISGSEVVLSFRKKGNTGDTSSLPFVVGTANSVIWFKYGVLVDQANMKIVNAMGFFFLGGYAVAFYVYALRRSSINKQIFCAMASLFTLLAFVDRQETKEEKLALLGSVGAALSVLFCAAPLASIGAVVKNKTSESLPFYMILMTFVITLQWWMFGFLIGDVFICYPNAIGCLVSGIQLYLFVIYPRRRKHQKLSNSETFNT